MFTGLVEIMGTVSNIQEQDNTESGGNGWTITVSDAADILTDCHLGDSIAINGTVAPNACIRMCTNTTDD